MRSRQAKGLQQRWLVVANNGVPTGSWKAAYKAKALRSRAYQVRAMPRFEIISSSRPRVPAVVPSGRWLTEKNCIWDISSDGFHGAWVYLRRVSTAT